jgi:D-beta-D-heptose 7-phosphate kinase/D-beta-D-heptose 1-phosphate adenosyltransferase
VNAASVLERDEAIARVLAWRAAGETIVFTNGVFDLLHRGHVESLATARSKGTRLVVGVNDDASVRRLKGPGRPLLPLEDRVALLAALRAVDLVTPFAEDTPEELIRALRPHVLVKGADYAADQVAGGAFVRSYGGRVEIIELVPGRSTSKLVERVLARYGSDAGKGSAE